MPRAAARGASLRDGVAALVTIFKYWYVDDCFEEKYGYQILSDLSRARRFMRWMVRVIEPYPGQRILEIGAGIGNISRQIPNPTFRYGRSDHAPPGKNTSLAGIIPDLRG